MQLRETKFTDSKLRSKKKKGEDEHQNYTAKDMATSTLPEVAIRDSNDQSSKVGNIIHHASSLVHLFFYLYRFLFSK